MNIKRIRDNKGDKMSYLIQYKKQLTILMIFLMSALSFSCSSITDVSDDIDTSDYEANKEAMTILSQKEVTLGQYDGEAAYISDLSGRSRVNNKIQKSLKIATHKDYEDYDWYYEDSTDLTCDGISYTIPETETYNGSELELSFITDMDFWYDNEQYYVAEYISYDYGTSTVNVTYKDVFYSEETCEKVYETVYVTDLEYTNYYNFTLSEDVYDAEGDKLLSYIMECQETVCNLSEISDSYEIVSNLVFDDLAMINYSLNTDVYYQQSTDWDVLIDLPEVGVSSDSAGEYVLDISESSTEVYIVVDSDTRSYFMESEKLMNIDSESQQELIIYSDTDLTESVAKAILNTDLTLTIYMYDEAGELEESAL